MALNKKGQTAMVGLMIGIFVFMMAMVFINPMKDVISQSRSSTELNCAAPTSDGEKMTCLILDMILPYFIAVVVAIAGGYIGAKIIG